MRQRVTQAAPIAVVSIAGDDNRMADIVLTSGGKPLTTCISSNYQVSVEETMKRLKRSITIAAAAAIALSLGLTTSIAVAADCDDEDLIKTVQKKEYKKKCKKCHGWKEYEYHPLMYKT